MSEIPDGLEEFLQQAGWGDAKVAAIPGDASFRRYFRVAAPDRHALLMHAPPPHEDPRPFIKVGEWLSQHGHRAPETYAADLERGLLLIEDFGHDRMRDWLDTNEQAETNVYRSAIDALVRLHNSPAGPFEPYDMAVYQREADLLPEWFAPAAGIEVDWPSYRAAWAEVLTPMLDRQKPGVTVLRDYHAENIMLLSPDHSGSAEQGLIDYQDALVGHPAYDLVSLLQDARRDVSPQLEREMLSYYQTLAKPDSEFEADYARLGAQRNAKIVGIFVRLWKRDGKAHYPTMIPRVWDALERDLAHPALAPVAQWFDKNIPDNVRAERGGGLI